MSRQQLAAACDLSEQDISLIESGQSGIPGELQDWLAEQGVNVSNLASEQSEYIANKRTGDKKSA